jgi:PAS domain S-box-containing protein
MTMQARQDRAGSPARILLVEDDAAHAELMRRAFESSAHHYELTVAATISEARALVEARPPDLVISDLRLPDGDGVELLPRDGGPAAYPVVIITSQGDERVAVDTMKVGALDYVVKTRESLTQMPRIAERALNGFRLIVERQRAEQALREREEHFRSLIENASDLISVIDATGVVQYMSPSGRRILGWPPEQMLGQNLLLHVHDDDQDTVRQALREAIEACGEPRALSVRVRTASGDYRVLEAVGTAEPGPAPRRVVVNSRDVTERSQAEEAARRLEAQLRQSQKLEVLGTLAGGIAHDFNNSLQAIQGCAELARASDSQQKARLYLDRLLEATRRGKELVRQILTFGRRAEQDRRQVLLAPILHETLELIRATCPNDVEVRCEVRSDATVLADATQIHQVVMNLCTNAQHAMEARGGTLELSLDTIRVPAAQAAGAPTACRYVRIGVRDTGCGMSPATQERIFEPFFTTKGVGKGTGLGLSVVHGIVTSHGGTLRVESRPGEGALFEVFLPVVDAEPTTPPPASALGDALRATGG